MSCRRWGLSSQYLVPGRPILRAEQAEQSDTVFTCLFARVIIQHLHLLRAGTQRVEDLRGCRGTALNSAATTRGLEGKNRGSQVRVGARQLSYTILYSLTRGVCGGVERSSSRRGPFPRRTRRRVNRNGRAFRRVLNPSTRALRCQVSGTLGLPPPAVEIRSVMHHGAANEKTIIIINRRRRRRRREGGRV